ncbi:YolD-like protein [Planococcus massiliensis]|uniref:YolD-like protein n=1 Tax=Planococcus massiliensis TaxID=1499687 RepID=A0A098EHK2_9BACL|nr:YolD-like family protein [Planococcus massiliensis]CEG21743.1 YolD-like protein [Planococcus massiliensis]
MKINKQLTLNGQIKDRGGIKWTAMMLPEHVQMLRDWQKEDPFNKKPDLDAFDLEAIYEEIHLAVVRQCAIEIRLWRSQSQVFTGTIAAIDLNAKFLFLDIGLQSEKISFAEIIGAKTIE